MTHPLPHASHPVVGEVQVPGSKSETNRALVLAALGDGPSTLDGALRSRDSDLMIGALRAVGVDIDDAGEQWRVQPPDQFTAPAQPIDCGLAGTVMRFVPPVAALSRGQVAFTGDQQASARPMQPLLDGLWQLGVDIEGVGLPFALDARGLAPTREVVIDASASSQFISGLLLVGSRLPGGLRLRHKGDGVPSRPHIQMTVEMLRERGVQVDEPSEDSWVVSPGAVRAMDTRVEPDLTNAAVFLAAGALTGGEVSVAGWPPSSLQPGAMFLDVAARMGAAVQVSHGQATVCGTGGLHGIDVDLHAASELTPVVAALAALARGTTRISGVAHIRGHETDRLRALAEELQSLGVEAAETADGLVIEGQPDPSPTRTVRTHADHRMVHMAALVGLRAPGVEVDDLECVGKTMPDFPQIWQELVA